MLGELQGDDPQFIGPYRLRGLLSVGGMGRVFLGHSAEGQLVAVKVIRADLSMSPIASPSPTATPSASMSPAATPSASMSPAAAGSSAPAAS